MQPKVSVTPRSGHLDLAQWSRREVVLSTAAHELRNSLGPLAYSVAVLAAPGDTAEREVAGRIAARQIDCMRRLISDLEDIGQRSRMRHTPLLLQEQLEAAVQACTATLPPGGPRLSVSFTSEPLWIDGDEQRLAEIFDNLLSNAVKFTGRGGTITVSASRIADRADIRIRDTGAGIAPDKIEGVFELFRREKRTEQLAQGFGIGLALVRHLVQLHGGTVRAESAGPGRGTLVIVQLPLADKDQAEASHASNGV